MEVGQKPHPERIAPLREKTPQGLQAVQGEKTQRGTPVKRYIQFTFCINPNKYCNTSCDFSS